MPGFRGTFSAVPYEAPVARTPNSTSASPTHRGHIVEKDPTLAAIWWHMAASGGDAATQFNPGMMAAEANGQEDDFDNAVFR